MTKVVRDTAVDYSDSIIERAKNGDERAFNTLVDLWFGKIYNFCLKYFGNHDLAMETTQRTFIALYRNLPGIRDNDRLKFWLYKVARNQCHEEERRNKHRSWLSLFQNHEAGKKSDPYFHPERKIDALENEQWINELLQRIPEDQRMVIIMKEYENMKFREIAELLDISVNTVKSRLYYGLNGLRKLIESRGFNYHNEL